jgi:hypothetical protein
VLETLSKEAHDVLVVERIEDRPAIAPRTNEAHAPEEAELMRHRRLGEAEQTRDVAHTQLRARKGVENAHSRAIAQRLEGFGERLDRFGGKEARRQLTPFRYSAATESSTF